MIVHKKLVACLIAIAFCHFLHAQEAVAETLYSASECDEPWLSECSEHQFCPTPDNQDEFYFDVYGFGMVDYVQDFNRVGPAWASTLRPSRIPTTEGIFGSDGEAVLSARQSRLGVRANLPTSEGAVRSMFEIDMFGVGDDEGQTTIRLRHAYGEFGNWLGGQTHSLFMDINMFPNVIDYWGPAGMVFLRNPQIRWTPIRGDHTLAIAIEHPSEAIDVGTFDRVIDILDLEVNDVTRMPDFTWRYRYQQSCLHFQAAGIFRLLSTETLRDPPTPGNEPKSSEFGWGVNLTSYVNVREKDKIMLAYVFGEGIASYMNDGGTDLAPTQPFPMRGRPDVVPLRGLVAYYDLYWNPSWSSAFGYSMTEVDNLGGQEGSAFKRGQYVSCNLLHYPTDSVLCGIEYLWGQRTDFDGDSGQDNRIQVSFKYSF